MMVPRAFLFSPVSPLHDGKKSQLSKSEIDFVAVQDVSGLELHKESPHTSPVIIPPKRGPRVTPVQRDPARKGPKTLRGAKTTHRASSAASGDRHVPTSIASILEATAIPVPRRKRNAREPRKIPQGNHVQDFSKLLLEGVKSRDDSLMESTGNTMLDILLSPPEDNDRFASGSNCDSDSEAPSLSAHSLSIESVPSLDAEFESPSGSPIPSTPSSQRSPCERRYLRLSQYESCALDHPLLEDELSDSEWEAVQQPAFLDSTPAKSSPSRSFPRLGSTFKSNLTASLRAIKSAAQTVSTFATPSVQPDDFLTRSLLTITPKMTDDRRPPPMNEPPSPALRRYFNPVTVSPAEIYAYQEHPHENLDTSNCPVSVQMQTYHRSGKRGSRKSRFHLSGSKGRGRYSSPFDPEVPPMSRQREPRENSDFLRTVVMEMNMRRSGKLRDDIPTRARVWLPPRKDNQTRNSPYDYYEDEEEHAIPSRWVGISADSM
ncbi:hypothetical protein BDV37DRAFT_206515 [Aspergillus pseudonomiae]|uniref:Uncharacterized protein n=1 Tax=Aspergillus pseudonomiae TaxID=1506151 RepID=A0A5N7DNU6_9EURO|nr:uncharacterized protein BDV37DRAFT_206515 [Aspergillus pseudonomiae]KAE8407995.1 hypothetical protein BDV37DRAFT_206515 [Aspergillus pseudonomiae]